MATERSHSFSFIGTGALKKGTLLKLTTVYGELDLATAVGDVPGGVALEDLAADANRATGAGANIGVGTVEGETYKVWISAAAVAIGDALGATANGAAMKITLTTTYAQEWIFGIALSAATGTAGQIVEMRYGPQIAS